MSKQSVAKTIQRYRTPTSKACFKCRYYSEDNNGRNRKCLLGYFAVKKTATCDKFSPK